MARFGVKRLHPFSGLSHSVPRYHKAFPERKYPSPHEESRTVAGVRLLVRSFGAALLFPALVVTSLVNHFPTLAIKEQATCGSE